MKFGIKTFSEKMLTPMSRPVFRLGLYLLRSPGAGNSWRSSGAGNYWRFNSSSAPMKPAPVIPRREKEVFMPKFLQKSQELQKKENILKLVEL